MIYFGYSRKHSKLRMAAVETEAEKPVKAD